MTYNSNSKNMTLEDRIVQDLKENRLGALIGDEDALAALAKRAIDEALFKDRFITEGYGYNKKDVRKPSLVVETAKEIAEKAIAKCIDDLFQKVLEDPNTRKIIDEAIASLLPSIVMRSVDQQAMQIIRTIQNDAISKLATAFMSHGKQDDANTIINAGNVRGIADSPIT